MLILSLFASGETVPYGIIGLTDDNKVFVKGLDEDYYLPWLSGPIDNEDGDEFEAPDGAEFLKAVKYKLLKNVFDGELSVDGPEEVDELPDLAN